MSAGDRMPLLKKRSHGRRRPIRCGCVFSPPPLPSDIRRRESWRSCRKGSWLAAGPPCRGREGAPEHTQARWARPRQCRGRMQEPAATAGGVVPTGAGAVRGCCSRRGRYCFGLEPSPFTPPQPRPRPRPHCWHGPRPAASAGRRCQAAAAAAAARPCRSLPDGPSGRREPAASGDLPCGLRRLGGAPNAHAHRARRRTHGPAGLRAAAGFPARPVHARFDRECRAPGVANCAQDAGLPARALAQSAAKGAQGCRAVPKRSDLARISRLRPA